MRKELDIDWDSELKDNDTVSKLNILMDKFNSAIDKYVPNFKSLALVNSSLNAFTFSSLDDGLLIYSQITVYRYP
jgi:hypothetical protein